MPVPNLAVNILRETPPFRNASLRMLRDLVDRAGRLDASDAQHKNQPCPIDAAIVVVCRGSVSLQRRIDPGNADTGPESKTSRRHRRRIVKAGNVYWPATPDEAPDDIEDAGNVKLDAELSTDDAHVLWFSDRDITRFVAASPVLGTALDPAAATPGVQRKLMGSNHGQHAILLRSDETVSAQMLEPLAHLLAASILAQFDEPAAVVTFPYADDATDIAVYGRPCRPVPFVGRTHDDAFGVLAQTDAGPSPLRHAIYVEPHDGAKHPGMAGRPFHRIVSVCTQLPDDIPDGLPARLHPGIAQGNDVYFSSFIASILLPDIVRRSDGIGDWIGTLFLGSSDGFKAEVCELDGLQKNAALAACRRIDRDSCRIRFDPQTLARAWQEWQTAGGFAAGQADQTLYARVSDAYRKTADRWARAVTNRRVGIALSGGGAASYRLIPILKALEDRVPIDVVGGISGGALLGAYYCAEGRPGLKMAVDNALALLALLPLAFFNSGTIEGKINRDLGHRKLEDLDVRFLSLAATTNDKGRPEAHAITRGTLGAAVRASGAAPVFFSPTEKNGFRYTDGSVALAVPARVLKDYGADLVFACNSIPGPMLAEGLREGPGWYAYRKTPFGRGVDARIALEYLIERLSAEIADDAHGYIGIPPSEFGLLTTVRYDSAGSFAEAALPAVVQTQVQNCVDRWTEYLKGGRA